VRSIEEASAALEAGAHIIDLKEPAHGALGAVPHEVARAVLAHVAGRVPVSATIGDLPFSAGKLTAAVAATAQTGVDYIKIGLFAADGVQTPQRLAHRIRAELAAAQLPAVAKSAKLIGVLFADRAPDLELIDALADAGFVGVMLDTADKSRGRLPDHMLEPALSAFCSHARKRRLLVGLAGSLRVEDVCALLPMRPDYLGFRGALCEAHDRVGRISPVRIRQLRELLLSSQAQQQVA
jgi:uncharacterized protein (UPF0264 family)